MTLDVREAEPWQGCRKIDYLDPFRPHQWFGVVDVRQLEGKPAVIVATEQNAASGLTIDRVRHLRDLLTTFLPEYTDVLYRLGLAEATAATSVQLSHHHLIRALYLAAPQAVRDQHDAVVDRYRTE